MTQFFGSVSLLRYPGGKTRLIKKLWPYFDAAITGDHYAEPFAGGGSTFLHVARLRPELKITINDKDTDVANFWAVVCGCDVEFARLCAAVQESREPTDDPQRRLDYWHQIRGSKFDDPALAAFRFLFLNKTCFGGQVDASPMGGYEQNGWKGRGDRGLACQYDVDTILANLHEARCLLAGRTTVMNLDVFDFLHVVGQASYYLDPPYFPRAVNRLYRQGMSPGEHQRLAAFLRDFPHPWVLSYDNSRAVRELYAWANVVEIPMRSSHRPGPRNWKSKVELLILPVNHNTGMFTAHRKNIPETVIAFSSYEMEANHASQQTNMNANKKQSKMPIKGPQPSNGKVDWTTVRLATGGMSSNERGKIKCYLKMLQESEKSSSDFKVALGHMWQDYYRLVEPDKESFCEHLGLSVFEAEAILNPMNQPVSEPAPEEPDGKHAPETAPALEDHSNAEKHEDSQPPNHAAGANAPEPQPEVAKTAPTPGSQRRSPSKGNKPSIPSDKKAQPNETGEKKANSDADAATTKKPAPVSSGETPEIPAYEDHPYAAVFPLDDRESFDQLVDDIRRNGLREPIVLFEGKILDGRRRDRACRRLGTEPMIVQFEGFDPAAFVLSKNIHRRNLEKGQRAAIAAELLVAIEKDARERKHTTNGSTRDNEGRFSEKPEVEKIPLTDGTEEANTPTPEGERQKSRDVAGTLLDVNPHYVSDAKAIMENARDLHDQLKQGKITMSQAKRELAKRKPKHESKPKNASNVEPQPFTVLLWDQSQKDVPMLEILKDKKKRKTVVSAVVFHLTAQPKFEPGCESKDGFCDAALFVVPVDAPEPDHEHGGLVLQKPSCLFLVARTCGDIPNPETVPDQVIKGGAVEARKIIEKMWPKAPRLISNGNGTPPEGWQVS